jgi:SAM-dependent methyltransferase
VLELNDTVDQQTREAGRASEIEFWRDFMQSARCKLNWCDAIPNPECDQEIYILLRYVAWAKCKLGKPIDVLDIGSGPISILTHVFHGLHAHLKAADPLADEYERLWTDEAARMRAVRPVPVAGEDLARHFGRNSFDVSHIRNAIDHTIHPMAVMEQMIEITRKNGVIVVHGFENEAATERWEGFHQWNMRIIPGDMEFEGSTHQKYGVLATFGQQLELISTYTKRLVNGKNWLGFVAAVI